MKRLFKFLSVSLLTVAVCLDCAALTGSWRGKLSMGPFKLQLVFNFSEDADGVTSCTLDSPSQGARGIPATVSCCTADSVALQCQSIGASFSGTISGGVISGQFAQGDYTLPLRLIPDSPIEERRPQTPKPPYPYTTVDTVFTCADGAKMSATLTIPAGAAKKCPAVVMVTGSGPQNRDEEIFEHRPFAVIADYLARNGVASLRYDDRGTGKSTGDFASATTYTFRDDARSAVKFLCGVKNIGKVGVLGHSEGGTIAFMLGAEKSPDFIVSLAGMAESGKELLLRQNARALEKNGLSGNDSENSLLLIGAFFDEMAGRYKKGISTSVYPDSLARTLSVTVPESVIRSLRDNRSIASPWFLTFLGIDPRVDLSKIKCPLLAINGDKDTQVDAEANLGIIGRTVAGAQTHKMPSLNHLMQHAVTGDASEYDQIKETISPEVLQIILDFIRDRQ